MNISRSVAVHSYWTCDVNCSVSVHMCHLHCHEKALKGPTLQLFYIMVLHKITKWVDMPWNQQIMLTKTEKCFSGHFTCSVLQYCQRKAYSGQMSYHYGLNFLFLSWNCLFEWYCWQGREISDFGFEMLVDVNSQRDLSTGHDVG